jgi:transposase
MHRHPLSGREWNLLAPLMPRRAQTGRPPNNYRTIIDALLWLAKTGAPWRDLLERFGPGWAARVAFRRPCDARPACSARAAVGGPRRPWTNRWLK